LNIWSAPAVDRKSSPAGLNTVLAFWQAHSTDHANCSPADLQLSHYHATRRSIIAAKVAAVRFPSWWSSHKSTAVDVEMSIKFASCYLLASRSTEPRVPKTYMCGREPVSMEADDIHLYHLHTPVTVLAADLPSILLNAFVSTMER